MTHRLVKKMSVLGDARRNVTTDYTRFIVLGRSRTGSNFLRGLLNSHSRIVVFGELYADARIPYIDWDVENYVQSEKLFALRTHQPIEFLERNVFKPFPVPIAAVGFKLFYYHAVDGSWQTLWAYLASHTEIRVIHLKRRNILRTLLSRKRAVLTDEWIATVDAPSQQKNVPVFLSYEECLVEFCATEQWEQEKELFFAAHPKLDVYYTDLLAARENTLLQIQRFLGVEPEPLKPGTQKQSADSLAHAIVNYYELKEKFRGTRWQDFFEE